MSRRGELAIVAAAFVPLTVAMTYPQALHPGSAIGEHYDALFSVWRLAWVAHQLPRDAAHLFDANIFYPARHTLAYSDAMVLPAFCAAPFLWAGASPVVVYNVLLFVSFVAAGVSMYALARAMVASRAAAWFSACAFAFQPFRFGHYSQLELLWSWPIPLAFLAFHRLARDGTWRAALWLALLVAAQAWSCLYYAIFLVTALIVFAVALLWNRPLADVRRTTTRAAAATVFAAVLIAPYAMQYVAAGRSVGGRGEQDVRGWSATAADYVTTPGENEVYGRTLGRGYSVEHALFPGFLLIAAAVAGLWPPLDRRRIAYGIVLVLAIDWSLGFNGVTYPLLFRGVWVYRGLRVPARMFTIAAVALSTLAACGLARVVSRIENPLGRVAAALLAIGIVLAESATAPAIVHVPEMPRVIYSWLAKQPPSVVAEWPMPRAGALGLTDDPIYMYYSIVHWQRLVNGYSGFYPASYVALLEATATFPSDEALDALRNVPVEYVIVHSEFDAPRYVDVRNALARRPDVDLVLTERQNASEVSLYRLRRISAGRP